MADNLEEIIEEDVVEEETPSKTENDFIAEIIEDLTDELSESDDDFKSNVLISKVRQAYRKVKNARKYPKSYTDEMIVDDMEKYYSNIRDIALYYYNQVGGEFQKSHTESNVTRTWVDENDLYSGVYPLANI